MIFWDKRALLILVKVVYTFGCMFISQGLGFCSLHSSLMAFYLSVCGCLHAHSYQKNSTCGSQHGF
jgi:hypothetical protein